jgi:hypothetical protein
MPEPLSELFNGGIVTARHPGLLKSGELQRADDCVYREKDPAIWRAPGRTAVNGVALGSVWAGAASGVKGIAHLTFERTRFDQLLAYNGTVLAHAALTAGYTTAGTIDPTDLQLSCTTNGTTTLTSAALFGPVQAGWAVIGTNIAPGTTVSSVTNASSLVLSIAATGSGTNTLTFNPMVEIGGPASIAGTVSGTTTFTATTGFPFLADVVGSIVVTATGSTLRVTAVSGQSGTTGHYNIVTLSSAQSNGAATLQFGLGCVQTFADNGTTDEAMDFTQWGATYFVWLGRGPLQRMQWKPRTGTGGTAYDDALTTRPCGLNAVTVQPTVVQAANAAYAWPVSLLTGYFWFLCTEIWDPDAKDNNSNDTTNEVEGTYLANTKQTDNGVEPVAVNIPASTGYGVTITFPPKVNTGLDGRLSTHWGVYMYGPTTDNKAIPSLAAFRRVAKVRMNAASGQTLTLNESRATQLAYPTVNVGAEVSTQFTNPQNMLGAFDFNFARAKSGSSTSGSENSAPCGNVLGTFGFNVGLPYSGYSVLGIRVTVAGQADPSGNAGRKAGYYVYLKSGSKQSDPAIFSEFGAYGYVRHGGELDTWGVNWNSTTDLTGLTVIIGKTGTGSRQRLMIDGVRVEIFYQSGSINLNGVPFRCVTYRNQVGDTVSEPARRLPPECSTGDVFQGSLVLNDLADETAIRFSLPGEPEAFPGPYVMRFNTTKRKDRVTFMRSLGDVLVVGMENGIKRVNYLPSEQDTDFQTGIAHSDLATDHGIAGPLAAVKFDWPNRGTMLAYASMAGPMLTDAITTRPLNMDLDWANTVKLSALSSCVFRVYPKEKWLVLYYCPAGATHTKNTRALVWSYAADKMKDGDFLPCVGPLTISGRSSMEAMLSGQPFLLTGHETNGFVYQEDFGVAQASGYQVHNASNSLTSAPIVPIVKTRRLYPCGITHDTHLYKAYLLYSNYGSQITAVGNSTVNSVTLTSSATFGSVLPGMRVQGTGIDEGTIVLAASASSITLSRAANATGSGVTFSFDSGTVGLMERGASIGELAQGLGQLWGSTLNGDLLVLGLDGTRQGIELQIEKVPLTFTTQSDGYRIETATWADLSVNMRLHQFILSYDDQGETQTRSVA